MARFVICAAVLSIWTASAATNGDARGQDGPAGRRLATSAGSCRTIEYALGQIACDVSEAACAASPTDLDTVPQWFAPGTVASTGCCHCGASCDHTKETAVGCSAKYYDPKTNDEDHGDHSGDKMTSAGSCYDPASHAVSCDVAEAGCEAGKFWYAPGYVGNSGCCHCGASCDHDKETGEACEATYYDMDGEHPMPDDDKNHGGGHHGDKEDGHEGHDHGGHGEDHGDKDDGHSGHDHGGHGEGECGGAGDASEPETGPCAVNGVYPLYCSAEAADGASPSNGHHMMQGLFMPNGATPMCHGDYVGDAAACACPSSTDDAPADDPCAVTAEEWASYGTDSEKAADRRLEDCGSDGAAALATPLLAAAVAFALA
eukprot:CAMPEP_0119263590 /NCGR_PEP_ID=MMETSP1329-20130426/2947_1 /TAXON_ID=114041 /ORGANISM="Genus nov. species nov., Strain RCC1024" /LENGTH=372 /DNA_ID=CAMNT_0007263303 /DNA_START=54 /DNA_END=1172 /DNA_ORIENTATION=-